MKPKQPAKSGSVTTALNRFRREALFPLVKRGAGAIAVSRFGGRPALRPRETWPICRDCRSKMPLFIQIDLTKVDHPDSTPDALRRGLFQLFYCTDENCEPDDCGAFASNMLARIVPAKFLFEMIAGTGGPRFTAKQIVGWNARADLPNAEEAMELGIRLSGSKLDEFYIKKAERGSSIPLDGDKLYGWPGWVQGMFYPECPKCKKKMIYLYQMDSEDHIPFMFGDSGVGHVCVCPDHPERASFYWSCC